MTLAFDGTRWADEPSDQGGRGQGRACPITRSTSLPSRRSQSDNARPVYHHTLLLHTAECLCPGRRRRRRVHPAVCRARHATRSITHASGPPKTRTAERSRARAGGGRISRARQPVAAAAVAVQSDRGCRNHYSPPSSIPIAWSANNSLRGALFLAR